MSGLDTMMYDPVSAIIDTKGCGITHNLTNMDKLDRLINENKMLIEKNRQLYIIALTLIDNRPEEHNSEIIKIVLNSLKP